MFDMTDNQLILRQNSWWKDAKNIENDPRLLILKDQKLVWTPTAILGTDLESDAVHILTGPRQVGKSTTVRMLMRSLLLEKRIEPRNVLLFNCDILSSPKEIVDVVIHYLDNISAEGRKYIFLDKISSVDDWPDAVKWLVDQGHGRGCAFFLTGSSSIRLKKSGEFLPGRRGAGKDIVQMPLTFAEFAGLEHPGIETAGILDLSFQDISRLHEDIIIKSPDIEKLFLAFWRHGGFLKPMNDMARSGFISQETKEIYTGWVKSELAKDNKKEAMARGILEKICFSMGSGLSYQNLAQHVDLGSHNTARAYLDFFINSFMVDEVPFLEISQKKVSWRKSRKYYIPDPFLHLLFTSWTTGGDDLAALISDMAATPQGLGPFVENLVQSHIRHYTNDVFYGEHRGREIDFCIPAKNAGIEVKHQSKITPSDVAAPKFFKNPICVSQKTLAEIDGVKVIPAFLFCLCRI